VDLYGSKLPKIHQSGFRSTTTLSGGGWKYILKQHQYILMAYVPFHEKFPAVAEKETRSITIFDNPELPNDTYGLIESYCADPGCDCRRVFLSVLSSRKKKLLAVIAFGWESRKYYAKWLGDNDPQAINDLKGPVLNSTSPQSKLAPEILELVNRVVLQDRKYIERLKTHYKLFRAEINEEETKNYEIDRDGSVSSSFVSVGRNEPCPCGSGKKYKKCCMK